MEEGTVLSWEFRNFTNVPDFLFSIVLLIFMHTDNIA